MTDAVHEPPTCQDQKIGEQPDLPMNQQHDNNTDINNEQPPLSEGIEGYITRSGCHSRPHNHIDLQSVKSYSV